MFDLDVNGLIEWASPSAETILGVKSPDLNGREFVSFIAGQGVGTFADILEQAATESGCECLARLHGGELRWMHIRVRRRPLWPGRPIGFVARLTDHHRDVLNRRARDTLSAANAALVRATSEAGLLRDMCDVPVFAGGYPLAVYGKGNGDGKPEYTLAGSAAPDVIAYLQSVGAASADDRAPTMVALRTRQMYIQPDTQRTLLGDETRSELVSRNGLRSAISVPVFCDADLHGALTVFAGEPDAFDADAQSVLQDLATQLGIGLSRLRTEAQLAETLADNSLLLTAVHQAAESIVVTDPTPAIVYANPATTRTTGYSLDEIIGRNPNVFKSGFHDQLFYEAMWSTLLRGQPFHGQMVNRRKSGEVYEEDATITPVRNDAGEVVAYVGVKHDLTRERAVEAALTRVHADRSIAVEIMRDIRPLETLEATADALALAIRRLPDIDGALVLMLSPDGEFVPVGGTDSEVPEIQFSVGEALPVVASQGLVDATARGPWWVDLADQNGVAGLFPAISKPMVEAGFVISAYAPIRWEGSLVGAISVTSRSPDAPTWIDERLPVLEELGTFAGMLFGARTQIYGDVHALRSRISQIIDEGRFDIVVQPIVELRTGRIVGREALTRFHDGERPNVRFNQAHGVGLGSALEAACVSRALNLLPRLPADTWLSVNYSPTTLIDGTAAQTMGSADPRLVVIEITEHGAIDNYTRVREAIAACGGARLAIDDTGAGFSSMRHILELRPSMVKLDMELVRGIDTDPARQSLAAGLRHFCTQIDAVMIGEGVETKEEADMLASLGVDLAQGYYFGRPAPLT